MSGPFAGKRVKSRKTKEKRIIRKSCKRAGKFWNLNRGSSHRYGSEAREKARGGSRREERHRLSFLLTVTGHRCRYLNTKISGRAKREKRLSFSRTLGREGGHR